MWCQTPDEVSNEPFCHHKSLTSSFRPRGDSAVFALDSHTSECLHYQPVIAHTPTRHVNIPRELLESHLEIDVRYDLIDCGIDICSVEVFSILSDVNPIQIL